jgi:hypothetical protein
MVETAIIRATMPLLDGARNTSASGTAPERYADFLCLRFLSGVGRIQQPARVNTPAALQRFLAPDSIETLQGDTKMKSAQRPSGVSLRKQLAKDLASVLNNPETPTRIYNSLSDEVLDLHSAIWEEEMDTERGILRALNYRAQLKTRVGISLTGERGSHGTES